MQTHTVSEEMNEALRHSASATELPVRLVRVLAWERLPWLWHGFSTRAGGVSRAYAGPDAPSQENPDLNLGFTAEDSQENVRENRRRLVRAVSGSDATPLITVRQIHSCHSEVAPLLAPGGSAAWDTPQADGILTRQSGILLGILTADCVPVLVADPRNRAVAAFHAGWRGTVQRVVELGIKRMVAEFGSEPGALLAAIGPAIGPCCYTVGAEVRARFGAEFSYADALFQETSSVSGSSELRLDLAEANRRQLIAAGLENSRISRAGGCTSCHPEEFYSHRASAGRAGRMMSVIGVRGESPKAS